MKDSPIAFMCVYNEADILPWTLAHLHEQGCRVHVIDNWSTDSSVEVSLAADAVADIEKWPPEGPRDFYDWTGLLLHVEELAAASDAPWCIHHDADEIRRTPWPGVTLAEGLRRVESEGYNAVDHQMYVFPPIDDDYRGDPEQHFRLYTLDDLGCRLPAIKAWVNTGARVDLASSGGHRIQFPGRSVYPMKWPMKHYPVRSQAHGERKVLRERLARYTPEERARGWHWHYDEIAESRQFVWKEDDPRLRQWGSDLRSPVPDETE